MAESFRGEVLKLDEKINYASETVK